MLDVLQRFTKTDVVVTGGALSSPWWLSYVNAAGAVALTFGGLVVLYWKIREAKAKAMTAEAAVPDGEGEM